MKVRRPRLDFSDTPAHWAAIPEFAQQQNAHSSWIPHLERFLNRVMAMAMKELQGDDAHTQRLRSDVRTFIRQEANHYSIHDDFNQVLKRDGYDIAPFERHFDSVFDQLLETKSLAFLCAYCEGFETMGPPGAVAWLGEMEAYLVGARPEVVTLWKWHLMEEYEHRMVCHEVYHRLHGGYFLRVYALCYQLFVHMGFSLKVGRHLLSVDRKNMSSVQRKASIKRARQVGWSFAKQVLPSVFKALSPFYSPRHAKEPEMYKDYMLTVEEQLQDR